MVDKLDDVWTHRDFPVLLAVTHLIDQGELMPRLAVVAGMTDVQLADVELAAKALERRGLVSLKEYANGVWGFTDVAGEAYFLTGLHPNGDDAISDLVAALRQAADQVEDPAEKSRLRTMADMALGISRDVLASVLVAVATKQVMG
jgi:hypothetical protein